MSIKPQEFYSIHCLAVAHRLERNGTLTEEIKNHLKRLDVLLGEAHEEIRKLKSKTTSEKLRECLESVEQMEWSN